MEVLRCPEERISLHTFSGTHSNKIYKGAIRKIISYGNTVAPRGKITLELQPAVHEIKEPHKKLCTVPGRKANPFFNMAENMWILGGHGDSEWISSFNNKLNEFQGDEGHKDYNAPYGRRIRFANRHRSEKVSITPYNETTVKGMPQVDQILHCYQSLKKDKDSRQAVISLWNPVFDNFNNQTKDRPCNTTIYFKIRNDKLNMTVSNRSNDLHLGLYGVNFIQFSTIQEFLAASLTVGVGQYIHLSDSLHIYDDSQHTNNILNAKYSFDIYDYVNPGYVSVAPIDELFKIPDQVKSNSEFFKRFIVECNKDDNNFIRDITSEQLCELPYQFEYRLTEINKYSKACSLYLYTYDAYKNGNYPLAIKLLERCNQTYQMEDWVFAGLEFMMRKKEFKEHYANMEDIVDSIINYYKTLDKAGIKRVLKWFHEH